MAVYFGASKWRESTRLQLLTLLIFVSIVNSIDISTTLPLNHKEPTDTIKSIDLKMEARNDEISDNLEIPETTNDKLSKVYPVYPESRSNFDTKLSTNSPTSWKTIKTSTKDSYLDALNYSHLKNNQPETIYTTNVKTKNTKIIRRNYDTPVYRPTALDIEISKEPKILVKPTQNPFLPTPSDSYSLPIKDAASFTDQNAYGTLENNNDYEIPNQNYGTPNQDYGIPNQEYGTPSQSYGTPTQNYGTPSQDYGTPQINYGTPIQNYGPPLSTAYGPPKPTYGPPAQHQGYGASSWSGYQLPSLPQLPSLSNIGLAWPLAIKLNAFTIAKIILKLVIFKMIVKFIAVICLLLFIPKLQAKKEKDGNDDDEDDDDERGFISENSRMRQLNILTAKVLESIEKYENKNQNINNKDDDNCSSMSCRVKRLIGTDDTWDDYFKLFNSYAAEEDKAIQDNSLNTKT